MRWTLLVIHSWSRAWYYYGLSGLLPLCGHWRAAILGALRINWLKPAFGWNRGSARSGGGRHNDRMADVLCPVVVGRQAELAELDAALTAALGGAGRLVFVVGEPGIGKSRLAREVAARARAVGATVV